jgi:pimeloyl-ACP methyl ester carboxylesterase
MSIEECADTHAMMNEAAVSATARIDRRRLLRPAAAKRPSTSTGQMSDIRFVTLHGHRVAYRDVGDPAAEPLLLIHGVGGSSHAWLPIFKHLSGKYRVIAPDLIGHGMSDKPRTDYSLGAFAVWMRDFLDVLDIRAATIVGHSLGGGIALQLVQQHRQYCRRLILVNSGGLGTDVSMPLRLLSTPGAEMLLPLLVSRPAMYVGNGVLSLLTARGIEATKVQERWRKYSVLADPHGRHAVLRTLRSVVDLRGQMVCALDRLPRLVGDLPTLIVAGAQDRVIPTGHAEAAHAALPGSRLEIIEDAGHHPQLDCPETLAALVDEFVAADELNAARRARPKRWRRPMRRGA